MAVNTNDANSGDMTNVVLKSRYANLNLKINDFESQVNKALIDFKKLINRFLEMTNQSTEEIKFTFSRTMIFNETEAAELANESIGALSEETRLSHDPRVKNAEQEIAKMRDETNPLT